MANIKMIGDFERCPLCGKILFRKKGGGMKCSSECQQSSPLISFNTLVEPPIDRRGHIEFDPRRYEK